MATAYIGIGSNKGDRLYHLEQAVALIERAAEKRARLSPVIETEPWGFSSPRRFLNMVIAVDWEGTPHELLSLTQRAERMIDPSPHRDSSGAYVDRRIDIDLLAIDGEIVNDATLTLPHPRMMEREFVTAPLRELSPGWRHPVTNLKLF